MKKLIEISNYQSEWDSTQNYRITPLIVRAQVQPGKKDVTLVTQTSLHNIRNIIELVKKWQVCTIRTFKSKGKIQVTEKKFQEALN